jgi:hypothetical protein
MFDDVEIHHFIRYATPSVGFFLVSVHAFGSILLSSFAVWPYSC